MIRKARFASISSKNIWYLFLIIIFYNAQIVMAQSKDVNKFEASGDEISTLSKPKIYYGIASFYADKFNGRQTANGDIYNHSVPSAACNVLPLGTWIRVTNLKNNRTVIVRVNDRLHPRMKRIVDLNKGSAIKLGYVGKGLEEVKVEVLGVRKIKTSN
ncbi:MAG: septal ring lytic transglycosylase RlpA family protein [Chitinophagaceae bacterium]